VENNYVESDHLICFSKQTEDLSNVILVVVNLDPAHRHTGWLNIPLEEFGLKATGTFQVQDLLQNTTYRWSGAWNYVDLEPSSSPAHIIRLRNRNHSEQDFEYYT
jgi:starch synthase (maltosyl-transferring)